MPIIDAHQHIGSCQSFLIDTSRAQLMDAVKRAGVDKFLLMPFPGNPDPFKENEGIAALRDETKGKVFGITAVNPIVHGIEKTLEEIDRTVKSFDFRAVKIHTIGWSLFPFSPLAEQMIKKAEDLGVPVMVHTGQSLFAKPSHVDAVAKKFPNVTFILAHMGWVTDAAEAITVGVNNKNVVVETSWSTTYDIDYAIKTLGADRVMIGSDLPSNMSVEIEKIKNLELSATIREKVLGGNAARVFKI